MPCRSRTSCAFYGLALFCLAASAAAPHIDKIEPFGKHELTIHFETEANRRYQLQYAFALRGTNTAWTNLFVVDRYPFPNHFVIVDTKTNASRYYRLVATP